MRRKKQNGLSKLQVNVIEALIEDPEENFVLFTDFSIKYYCDVNSTTLKEFYTNINEFMFPGEHFYKCYMFGVFEDDYRNRKVFSEKNSNKTINKLFNVNKPINLVYYPDYEGAGAWGESNGIRFDIRFNENNHMCVPHIHVSIGRKFNSKTDQINLVTLAEVENKDKKANVLNGKQMSYAKSLIKKHQKEFLEMWNEFAQCDRVVDVDYFIKHNDLKLLERENNKKYYSKRYNNPSSTMWNIKNGKIEFI